MTELDWQAAVAAIGAAWAELHYPTWNPQSYT
jgi:hypothetical protein